ncbi:hypothetical protein [Mesorhizobium sp. M4B.F.Ca.ET.058.02.1.1]|uniref:hypothetical protein n=1 Tax=Mesorhizobium sp. M4B.F.Ca.ET.058.02.1.1 TaxID=2493675 RepID=UPI000F763AC4|nr:hypothetical protein [Mesorhizobium sp. M4B.F.Ca.ET.058.02.1.1]AZO48044.1 hypothetical protein EJ073_09590 [Mesorhizobium sp. M4B.F.Ca.ET.058.02.1.1]
MAGYLDSIYQYGSGMGGTGAVATPYLTGGASNPVGSYFQSAASAPVSGISGVGESSDLSSILGYGNGPAGAFPAAPGASKGMFSGLGGVSGLDWGKLALGGLQTIGSLWQAWEANKLAKAQFNFQKEFAQKNLANQIQSYNTTLEDRSNSRAFTQGDSQATADAYYQSHKLPA